MLTIVFHISVINLTVVVIAIYVEFVPISVSDSPLAAKGEFVVRIIFLYNLLRIVFHVF